MALVIYSSLERFMRKRLSNIPFGDGVTLT